MALEDQYSNYCEGWGQDTLEGNISGVLICLIYLSVTEICSFCGNSPKCMCVMFVVFQYLKKKYLNRLGR